MTQDQDNNSPQNSLQPRRKPVTDTASLSGLRLYFNIFVVVLHSLLFLALGADYPTDVNKIISGSIPAYLLSIAIVFGTVSVDVFFLISGFLLKSAFANSPPTLTSSANYILFRYLRLAPTYLAISLALRATGAPNCLNPSETLFLNSGEFSELCIGVGWSTRIDFISHILLIPILNHPRILVTIVLLTSPFRYFTWLRQGKPYFPTPPIITDFIETPQQLADVQKMLGFKPGNFTLADADISHRRRMLSAYHPLYFGLPNRMAAVVVGVLVYSCMRDKNAIYRTVRKFPAVSLGCMTLVWGFYYSVELFIIVSPFAQMVHHSLGRTLVSFVTAVVIMLTCNIEDTESNHRISRALRLLLTCRPVAFMQRFSYVVYILHMEAVPTFNLLPPKFNAERFTPMWVLLQAFKLYMVTVVISLPFFGIERLALRGRAWLRSKVSSHGQGGYEAMKKVV